MAIVETFPVGPLLCNMVIIADPSTLESILIDPGGDADQIIQLIVTRGFLIKQILITHAHLDHFLAVPEVSEHTKAPVFYHGDDRQLWLALPLQCMLLGVPQPSKNLPPPTNTLKHDDTLMIRNGRVIHTPGHTKGSVCFYFPDDQLLCSGDTLFAGGVGRTDLPGGSAEQLVQSIRGKLFELPEPTRVICGHGPETTIATERESNMFVR